MTSKKFRIFYNGDSATQDQLDRVEEISVEQETDAAWEARLQLSICLDGTGNWQHLEEGFMAEFSRVRIEIQIDNNPWVPLIDGPLVDCHGDLHSEPGKSMVTLVVQDDSVLLNRTADIQVNEGQSDSDLASSLFNVPGITAGGNDIQTATPSSGRLGGVAVQRGTSMQFLRQLARRNHFHAYVLPGDTPGQSRGCFKPYATDATTGLPDFVLLGDDRNIENFSASNDSQSATRYAAHTVSISDRGAVDSTSSFDDVTLLGQNPAYDNKSNTGQDFLSSFDLDEDPHRATSAATDRSAYSVHATGRTLPDCYDGILRAYDVVTVRVGTTKRSGKFVVKRVRHLINRSLHTQEFTLLGNASSTVDGSAGDPLAGIF
jgi:hypothetical protein